MRTVSHVSYRPVNLICTLQGCLHFFRRDRTKITNPAHANLFINSDCKCWTGELSELHKQTPLNWLYLFVVFGLTLGRECTPGLRRMCVCQSVCGSAIVTGISRWPLQATQPLWLLRCRWGAWPSWTSPEEVFLCLPVFVASIQTVIPQKTKPGFNILNPKRDLLHSLCIASSPPGVVEAIHWNSISYLCPLKSQYGVTQPLPALSWHALLLSPSSPHMPRTSKDILKLDICLVFICT